MSTESVLQRKDEPSAFSLFHVAGFEKCSLKSGNGTTPAFACTSFPYFSYPSLVGPPAYVPWYLGQEYGMLPSLGAKGVVQNSGPFLHSAPLPGMFGFHPNEDEKPSQSYIGLIGKAILSTPQKKLVLSDIYNYILANYPYFRNKGPGWRNSIRHNLSLNKCFVKVGRSPNGKGHFWAINPSNYEDFSKGEYRRKRTNKKRTDGENIKVKRSDREILPKPDVNTAFFEIGQATNETSSSGLCGAYPVKCAQNKESVVKENKGFHIETILCGVGIDIDSCLIK